MSHLPPAPDERPFQVPLNSHAPQWAVLARAMLKALKNTKWSGFTLPSAPVSTQPAACPVVKTDEDNFDDDANPWDAQSAQLELEFEAAMTILMPQRSASSQWRPKPSTLIAVLRIARTFETAPAMLSRLGRRGNPVLLCSGASSLNQTILRVLGEIFTNREFWPEPAPLMFAAHDAVRASPSDANRPLGNLADTVLDALESSLPIVFAAAVEGLVPQPVQDLRPEVVRLAPLGPEMLSLLLDLAYPASAVPADCLMRAQTLPVERLGLDTLILALRAPDPASALNAIERSLAPAAPNRRALADFPLPAPVRECVEQLLADLRSWREGEIGWHEVSRGMLLCGPPGSGKTELARLIGAEAGITVVSGSLAQWSADGARSSDVIRAMRTAFAAAAEQSPALLFIDELDAFGDRQRSPDHNSAYTDFIVTALLDFLDGFHTLEGVVVIGATNHLAKLDRAIIRPGRFDHVLALDHPGLERLPKALRWQLGSDLPDADLTSLARRAQGISGADIAAAVRAARASARRARRVMQYCDLESAIASIRPPLPEATRKRIAVHEAGHAIAGVATGTMTPTILAIQSDGGITEGHGNQQPTDRKRAEAQLTFLLAGRAAEILILKSPSAGAGGDAESDLARATHLAAACHASWGLGESLTYFGTLETIGAHLRHDARLRALVAADLERAAARADRILMANHGLLVDLSDALFQAGVVSGPDLQAHLAHVIPEIQPAQRATPAVPDHEISTPSAPSASTS